MYGGYNKLQLAGRDEHRNRGGKEGRGQAATPLLLLFNLLILPGLSRETNFRSGGWD